RPRPCRPRHGGRQGAARSRPGLDTGAPRAGGPRALHRAEPPLPRRARGGRLRHVGRRLGARHEARAGRALCIRGARGRARPRARAGAERRGAARAARPRRARLLRRRVANASTTLPLARERNRRLAVQRRHRQSVAAQLLPIELRGLTMARPDDRLAGVVDAVVANARTTAGEFLHCAQEETIFGANMTTLAFALTRTAGRTWREGDEIVVTKLDHDANVSPWLELAHDKGLTVHFVDIHEDTTLDLDDLQRLLNERTRVVAFPVASNAVGTLSDVHRIAELAHEAGALAWADAVHYGPHGPIDVGA